jgi:predicted aspartyl protease
MGGLRNPAYSFMATKTEITNDGNVVRLYATNGDVFETSIHNVVVQILGEEKEKLLQPK